MRDKRPTGWTGLAMPLIVAPLVPLALALLPIYLAGRGAYGALLEEWFRHTHAARGRHILFVTSDSPNWQKYIEARRQEKFPNIKLAALRPSEDQQKKAYDETNTVLNAHPNVKHIKAN